MLKKLSDEDFNKIFQDMIITMKEAVGSEENIDHDRMNETKGMVAVMIDVVRRYNEIAFKEND